MSKKKRKNELKMARDGKTVRLTIQGVIGWEYFGTTARAFREELATKAVGANTLEIEIDSPGGVITEGVAMANAILESDMAIHTYVSGEASSMGSVLLMAGDKIFVPANAMVMVHKPLNMVIGNADDMRKVADDLDKFEKSLMAMYMRHFKGTEEEMAALMSKETWLTADDMEAKFSNVVVMKQQLQAVACEEPVAIFGKETEDDDEDLPVAEQRKLSKFFEKHFSAWRQKPAQGQNQETEEKEMTPEQLAALKAGIVQDVVTALKEQGVIASEPAPATPVAIEIEFVGSKQNPEDVKAHLQKVKMAKLEAAVDWNDVASITAFYEAIGGKQAPAGQVPSGNAAVGGPSGSQKASDVQETRDHMNKIMPKA